MSLRDYVLANSLTDKDIAAFKDKIKNYSYPMLEKELESITKRLKINFIDYDHYVKVDISENTYLKNRLFRRNQVAKVNKWVNYFIKKSDRAFDEAWHYINAMFISESMQPQFYDERLRDYSSFSQQLSQSGLNKYKTFLIYIAENGIYGRESFIDSVRKSKFEMERDVGPVDETDFDRLILTKNWYTGFKNAMKHKLIKEKMKELKQAEENEQQI